MANGENQKNRSITNLMEMGIDFLIQAYDEACGLDGGKIFFGDEKCQLSELGENTVHKLFADMFSDSRSGRPNLIMKFQEFSEKSFEFKFGELKEISKNEVASANKQMDQDSFVQHKFWPLDVKPIKFEEMASNIESSFLSEQWKKQIVDNICVFCEKEWKLEKLEGIFPSMQEMDGYLTAYYNLLSILIQDQTMKDSYIRENVVKKLMELGMDSDGNYTICAPIVLNNVRKMFKGYLEFYHLLFGSLSKGDRRIPIGLAYMYKNILIAKTQRVFRWYMYDGNLKSTFAAVPPRLRPFNNSEELKELEVEVAPFKERNSYEGIGELRLAEKIKDEYERWVEYKSKKDDACGSDDPGTEKYKIALIGDINSPVQDLIKYLDDIIPDRKTKFIYNIYTKNRSLENRITKKSELKDRLGENGIERLQEYDQIFTDSAKLRNIMDNNNIVFFLDDIGLYREVLVEQDADADVLSHRYMANSFDRYNIWKYNSENNFLKNPLDNLYHNIVSYMVKGKFGHIEKRINENVIDFIERTTEGSKSSDLNKEIINTTAYVYVSDLDAFQDIYFREHYQMRVEQYNEKKIGIVRFSSMKEAPLDNHEKCTLVMTLWQIVKHFAMMDKDVIADYLVKEKKIKLKYEDMRNVYIGLNYKMGMGDVKLWYYFDADWYRQKAEAEKDHYRKWMNSFLRDVFVRLFDNGEGSIYGRYCKDAIVSFLYGDANTVEDILFVHLLKNGREIILNCDEQPEEMGDDFKNYRNPNMKRRFSNKRLYDLAMEYMDVAFVGMTRQYKVNALFGAGGISEDQYKAKIVTACKRLHYDNSALYNNCKMEM